MCLSVFFSPFSLSFSLSKKIERISCLDNHCAEHPKSYRRIERNYFHVHSFLGSGSPVFEVKQEDLFVIIIGAK
jgi:hypothetical protein